MSNTILLTEGSDCSVAGGVGFTPDCPLVGLTAERELEDNPADETMSVCSDAGSFLTAESDDNAKQMRSPVMSDDEVSFMGFFFTANQSYY